MTNTEKKFLSKLLDMGGGYVLNFSNDEFSEFFREFGVNIDEAKYKQVGTSKGKRLRTFWEVENDKMVGKILERMLESYDADCLIGDKEKDVLLFERCESIVDRLLDQKQSNFKKIKQQDFLDRDFKIPDLDSLPIEPQIISIIELRFKEAKVALQAKAYLSCIFMCGSILEALLLGIASNNPALFNKSKVAPLKKDGKVKQFHEWTLSSLINVSTEVGVLNPDIKKFSHGLRDFRNYIHPYEQLRSGFSPDEHTAKVCFQVLKAALANISGKR